MTEIFQQLIDWYMGHIGYGSVFFLMVIESSFIPFPSEIVIPPAAYLAAQGQLNIYLVFIFGTLGAMVGAIFNYYIAFYLGRKLIYRLANTRLLNLMMINEESVLKSEKYFIKNGKISTLIGRLLPGIRQLISIPAGLAKMNMRDFLIYTFIGAAIWNAILAALGYFVYSQKELLDKYYSHITYACIILGAVVGAYMLYKALYKSKSKKSAITEL